MRFDGDGDKDKTSKKNRVLQPDAPPTQPKSRTDEWRDAERAAQVAERNAEALREKANTLASGLAKELIDNHGGANVELDGVKYAPKSGATRKLKDDTTKAPRYPFQLVRAKDKGIVEV